ncbi:glutathione-independent formaldehyde dehydrogenase [Modestobacter muralis]|uniref:Alcohol dehydrogenase catalytic domain-containing protein n=1 Tax=Modestobacter muralis TaxID=1608614 RepID=A0A6P0HC11_9ACTN|nr:glutathione-independent formaldehyde dehydrogenase [Modestobacter muralis]NEK96461.1 alcohol dehydrogenase catalytic domain-containing protein [Modestobacter muralis]NEN53361.1 alcohol dehydrogenase catalytic domain-containing protein [Modestobacter muralis]
MRALVYNGPRDVSVQQVPDAKVEHPTDAVIRVTATNICGSDLHMYEGRTDLETGMVIGHENLGEVVEVGAGVTKLSVGDRVVLPFNIGCGFCENCEQGRTGFCLTVNPGVAGGAYGFAGMGGYSGGQAEYLRVPFADFNALQLPEDSVEKENDYVMLADIFPTGWHGTRLAKVAPGDSVTVYGGGPVGLMAGYSAVLQGASEVYVIDHLAERLALAEEFGAIGINSSTGDPIEQIKDATKGRGTDRGVEAIGYQAHDSQGVEQPNMTMNGLVEVVKATGTIGVVGLFLPEDPGASDELAKKGQLAFDYGKFWFKGQTIGNGQANVKNYNRALARLIHQGKATPARLVSHNLGLDEAPEAYRHFDARDQGWTKVVLNPTKG